MMTISRAAFRALKQTQAERAVEDESVRLVAKADAFVQQFIEMTPAEVDTWITSNVTDLASARNLLKKISIMLLLLARREFRD